MSDATTTKSRTAAPRAGATAKSELRAQLRLRARQSRRRPIVDRRGHMRAAASDRGLRKLQPRPHVSFDGTRGGHAKARRARHRRRGKASRSPRCVPKTREMNWHLVKNLDGLIVSSFGIEEPADDDVTLIEAASMEQGRTLAVVPGLAFDREGYRLGYGGASTTPSSPASQEKPRDLPRIASRREPVGERRRRENTIARSISSSPKNACSSAGPARRLSAPGARKPPDPHARTPK